MFRLVASIKVMKSEILIASQTCQSNQPTYGSLCESYRVETFLRNCRLELTSPLFRIKHRHLRSVGQRENA